MSKTRIPANGKVGESGRAALAKPRQNEQIRRLRRDERPGRIFSFTKALIAAIVIIRWPSVDTARMKRSDAKAVEAVL